MSRLAVKGSAKTTQTHAPDGITILGVQFESIKALFEPLIGLVDVNFIHVNDWLNELRFRYRSNAFVQVAPLTDADWLEWRLPPGWTNRLAPWVMPMLARRIQRIWRDRGWDSPRLVVTFPYYVPLAREVPKERLIYYAVDNYQAYWPDRSTKLLAQEDKLIDAACATVAASSELATWFRTRVPTAAAKIHYVPNGVRPDMVAPFEDIKSGPLTLTDDLARRFGGASGPVVGCYGHIGPGYGIEFLAAVVKRLPNFRFLLVGQVLLSDHEPFREAVAYLKQCTNVVFTGPLQEPNSLNFLRQCDAMIIPLPLTAQIRYSCPNRLWTYLATARPIVSTPIPEVTRLGELVYIAADVETFVDMLHRAVGEHDPQRVTKRFDIAKDHTWPVLAKQIWSIFSAA